jgi:hypothetical protein
VSDKETASIAWLIFGKYYGWKFIKAESPCWKGEICLGWMLAGWQRGQRDPKLDDAETWRGIDEFHKIANGAESPEHEQKKGDKPLAATPHECQCIILAPRSSKYCADCGGLVEANQVAATPQGTPTDLLAVIERLANHGSVEDYTVEGIRAELRDALRAFRPQGTPDTQWIKPKFPATTPEEWREFGKTLTTPKKEK